MSIKSIAPMTVPWVHHLGRPQHGSFAQVDVSPITERSFRNIRQKTENTCFDFIPNYNLRPTNLYSH